MYCDLKAAGGWALYCNTMRSQDATRCWVLSARQGRRLEARARADARGAKNGARGAREGRAGWARGAQARYLCAPRHAVRLWAMHLVNSGCF